MKSLVSKVVQESRRYGLCRNWLYRKEISQFFGLVGVGEVCWMCRGPIGKDETDGEMVLWFQKELAIPGGQRAEFCA